MGTNTDELTRMIDVAARRLITVGIAMAIDRGDFDHEEYPHFGANDLARVRARMEQILADGLEPLQPDWDAAYAYLCARANDDTEVGP